jgi:predicted ester cyclase
VSTRYRVSGTHEGELLGIASTSNRAEITGISIMSIEGGKIEEIWENYDALGMLQQFGVVPPQA